MKKELLFFWILLISLISVSQTFKAEDLIKSGCTNQSCASSFLTGRGFSLVKKETGIETYLSNTEFTQKSGDYSFTVGNSVTTQMIKNGSLLEISFTTISLAIYDKLIEDLAALGYIEEGKGFISKTYPGVFFKKKITTYKIEKAEFKEFKFYWVSFYLWKEKPIATIKEPTLIKPPVFEVSSDEKFFYYENWAKAKAGFKKSADKDATSAYWLIETMLADGSGKEEITKELEAVEKKFPGHSLIAVARGHLLLSEGKTAEVKSIFEKAITGSGTQKADVLNAIGRAHGNVPIKYSDPEYGISKIKEALLLQPQNPFAYINMGDCYRRKLDGGSAVEAYSKTLKNGTIFTALAKYKIGKVYATQQNCDALTRYFNESVNADPNFMPAWRELFENYSNYLSNCYNLEKAKTYFEKYISTSNPGNETEMLRADYAYVTKDYTSAIETAKKVITAMNSKTPARLYKLIGYSYFEQKDLPNTIKWMEDYFLKEKNEEGIVPHNFSLLADSYALSGQTEKGKNNYLKAASKETDKTGKIRFIEKAAELCKNAKDYNGAAVLYQQISDLKPDPSASDLYKTGTAYYNGGNYISSKKVFETYTQKYSNDWRGYFWQARSSAQTDSLMKTGEAAPLYEKYISLGAADPANKKATIEAYMYLFAVSYNLKKDKALALSYLDMVLALDPQNTTAINYKELLNKKAD